MQVIGKDGREIGRNERLPFPLRGAGDHDRFRLVGQVQRQELSPQLPELFRHDGSRLAICDQFIIEFGENDFFGQTHGSGATVLTSRGSGICGSGKRPLQAES